MSLIPPESDFEELCTDCEEFFIPFWTKCACEDKSKKINLDTAIKELDTNA